MAACMIIVLAVMSIAGCFYKLPKPVEFTSHTTLDLKPSPAAKWAGLGVVAVTILLYVIFR